MPDWFDGNIRFMLIIGCFLLSFSYKTHGSDIKLLRLCMLLTVIADFFLLIIESYIIGVGVFCCVQMLYTVRYSGSKALYKLLPAAHFVMSMLILSDALGFMSISFLTSISFIYAMCIITSVGTSILCYYKTRSKTALLSAIGMVLFLLCDINVALYNSDIIANHDIFELLIWVFYLPAQVMLALSGKRTNEY